MDDNRALDNSPENHSSDDYEPFPIDFSEWTLLDDIFEDDDNCLEDGDAQAKSDDFPKSSSNGSNVSVNSVSVNEKDSYDNNKKKNEKHSNSVKEASDGTASKTSRSTGRLSSQKKSTDNDLSEMCCSSAQTFPKSSVIKPSNDSVVYTASNSVPKERKENIPNNSKVEKISKLHSKAVRNDGWAQKPAASLSNKPSAMRKQNQDKNFGMNTKSVSGAVIHTNKDFVSDQGAKPDLKRKTVVDTELAEYKMDHCGNTVAEVKQISKFFEEQKFEKVKAGKLKRNRRRRKAKNNQLLQGKEPEITEAPHPPPQNIVPFTQMCQAHLEDRQTQDSNISKHLSQSIKETGSVGTVECSAGVQQKGCSVPKRIVRRFHQAAETDAKTFLNKKFVQCGTKHPLELEIETSFAEQYAPNKTRCEKDTTNFSNHSSELASFNFPSSKIVSKEIFNMAMNFEVSNPFISLSPFVNFDYGIRVGYLLPSDVDKASFRDTFIKKADSYNLFFGSPDSGVLDLFFDKEESLANMVNHIRKARLGLRHICLSIYKMSNEKDANGEVPVKCLKATIIFDQNFVSSAYLSYYRKSMQNRPKVDQYITIHNVPEGIPLSFLSFIFPDAITVELADVKLKFTKKGCGVRLGLNQKNYPEHFKDLFCQVFINNVPLSMTSGLTEEKVTPVMKVKPNLQKKPTELKQKIQHQKEKDTKRIQSTVTVAKDINGNEKKSRPIECREEKIVTATDTLKSSALNAELPPPEDVIDLTGEASSPFVSLNEELSDISDSSLNSDDLEGPLCSSSEDERNSQSHGREKSSKTFDRLFDKYVLKKRRKERHKQMHGKARSSSDRDIAKTKDSKLCGVTRDMLSSIRTNRKAEKSKNLSAGKEPDSTSIKEPSDYSSECRRLKRREKSGKRAREGRSFSDLSVRDKKEHGNTLRHRGSNSPPISRTKLAVLEHRTSKKMSMSQEKRIAESSRSLPSQHGPLWSSSSRQINRQISHSSSQSEEGDLRLTLDNMKTIHHGKKTKEGGGGTTEDGAPAFRSLLGECLSQVNRKRPSSRSPSPTQRKVLLVKRSFSPTLELEEGEVVDSSHAAAVSERNQKLDMSEPLQKASQSSSNEISDLHALAVQASDNVLDERHQFEPEKKASQEQFTVSKSFLVKLMTQIIKKDAQLDGDNLLTAESNNNGKELETLNIGLDKDLSTSSLTSESNNNDKEFEALNIGQDKDLSTSSLPKDRETSRSKEEELQRSLQLCGKSIIDASTIEKISETNNIPLETHGHESKKEDKSIIETKGDTLEGIGEMPSKTEPQKENRNSTPEKSSLLDKSSSELPILPPPIPPPVFPSILTLPSNTASAEKPCPQSDTNTTALSSDPLDASLATEKPCSQLDTNTTALSSDPLDVFSEGGVWMAPPPMTTTYHHEPLSTISVSSMPTPPPALSHISPTILQPPMMHPLTFVAPPPFHPHVLFPPHQLQVLPHQLQASSHQLQASSHQLQASSHQLQAPSHQLQAPSHQLQASSHQLQAPPHQLQVPQATVHNELIPLSGVWQAPTQGPF